MAEALAQARLGREAGEVPIGAVLVIGTRIVSRAFNRPIGAVDPTAHAEVLVLREARTSDRQLPAYRRHRIRDRRTVPDVRRGVGPCAGEGGRLRRRGAQSGALVSSIRALEATGLNHRFTVAGGVMEEECRDLIQQFFRDKRQLERMPGVAAADSGTL